LPVTILGGDQVIQVTPQVVDCNKGYVGQIRRYRRFPISLLYPDLERLKMLPHIVKFMADKLMLFKGKPCVLFRHLPSFQCEGPPSGPKRPFGATAILPEGGFPYNSSTIAGGPIPGRNVRSRK
jgi:hypothetical protein